MTASKGVSLERWIVVDRKWEEKSDMAKFDALKP
jgi:hypothetical protein